MEKQANIAVITGDLVGSTSSTSDVVNMRLETIAKASNTIANWGHPTNFTRQSGDGWQITTSPKYAVRAALYIRASLMQTGEERITRMFIASGNSESQSKNLNEATDPVFIASGRGLATLSKKNLLGHASGAGIAAATRLLDHISQGWTGSQAKVMRLALLPQDLSQKQIAKELGISQQSVQQSQSAAGLPAIRDALRFIEDI